MDQLSKSARRPKFDEKRKIYVHHNRKDESSNRSYKKSRNTKQNRIFVYRSLERIHQNYPGDIDPNAVPQNDIVSLNLSIDRIKSIGNPKALADTGAIFNVITDNGINRLRELAGEPIRIRKGTKQYVENGSGEDVLYDGRHIELSIERPAAPGHYVTIRFDVSPVPLSFDFILGGKTMKALGYITVLADDTLDNIYIHERDSMNFDVARGGTVYEMMDYFNGDKISEFRERQGIISRLNDEKVDAMIDGVNQHKNDDSAIQLHLRQENDDTVKNQNSGNIVDEKIDDESKSNEHNHEIQIKDSLDLDAYDLSHKLDEKSVSLEDIESIHDLPKDLIQEQRDQKKDRLRFHVFDVKNQNEDDEDECIEEDLSLESLLEFDEYYEDSLKEKTKADIRTIITNVWNEGWVAPKWIARLKRLCLKYSHRMATAKFDMGCINGFEYKINL